jgi:hypothetical protein
VPLSLGFALLFSYSGNIHISGLKRMIEKIYCKDCFFFSVVEGTLKDEVVSDRRKGIPSRTVTRDRRKEIPLDDYEDGHGQCHRYPPVLKPHEDYLHYEFHNEVSNNFVFVSFEDWCGEAIRTTKKIEISNTPLKNKVKGKLDPKVLKVKLENLKLGWGLVRNIRYRNKYFNSLNPIGATHVQSVENKWVGTIEDILEFPESAILGWKGFGPKKLEMIKSALNQEGIYFIDR